MFKSRVIKEGHKRVYIRVEDTPARNDCSRVLVACTVGRMRPLVREQTRGKRHGGVGQGADVWGQARSPGADAAIETCALWFRRKCVQKGRDGWDHVWIPSTDGWDRARTLFARTQLRARTAGPIARKEFKSLPDIVVSTRVWARMGGTSGTGPNGHILERAPI
jgi:hypothetical protein